LFTLLKALHQGHEIVVHAALMNDGELARRLRACNLPVTIFDETRLGGPGIVTGLRTLMKSFRPDVVHTHRQKENVLGAITNALTAKAQSVRTCHGATEHRPSGLRNLHKRLFYTVDEMCGRYLQHKIIAVSAALGRDLAKEYGPARVAVIENGVDVAALAAISDIAEFRRHQPDAMHVGIVGRLEKVKRVDLFLQMARVLRDRESSRIWHFHVIGDGSLRASLETLSTSLGLDAMVTFHGHRADSAMYLKSLDVLVMCSDHEGMPMTPLEAIACGTPVVAHDVGGLSDILADGGGGVLTSDHSPHGYANALLEMTKGDIHALMVKGLQRVSERFSAQSNAQAVTALYRSLF